MGNSQSMDIYENGKSRYNREWPSPCIYGSQHHAHGMPSWYLLILGAPGVGVTFGY